MSVIQIHDVIFDEEGIEVKVEKVEFEPLKKPACASAFIMKCGKTV